MNCKSYVICLSNQMNFKTLIHTHAKDVFACLLYYCLTLLMPTARSHTLSLVTSDKLTVFALRDADRFLSSLTVLLSALII